MALPVIRTPRLRLRPWTRDDVDALHALWTAPEVRRYLWDDVVIARNVAEQVVASQDATVESHAIGYWAAHAPPESAALAGFFGFRPIDPGPEIELMYGLRGTHWGQGLATEACRAILDYLWTSTGYARVYARTDPPNEPSVRVMQRLGMTHDSTTASMVTYVLFRPAPPAG